MIKPTVGRVVWFTPHRKDDPRWDITQPLSASVAYVHDDRMINIGYIDQAGVAKSACSVPLLQDDDAKPEDGYFASWMPLPEGTGGQGRAARSRGGGTGSCVMSEQEIEKEIIDKGLTAPRVTPAQIDAVIQREQYTVFPGSQLTVCCLTLANGFTVTGESACASPENFNEELGRKIAREKARDKIWALEGYLLKEELFRKQLEADHAGDAP